MEQVRNEQTIYSAAVYCRLSKDDEQAGESVSIETQKMMLTDFCHERGFSIYEIYADDGYSGLNFNRPAFTRLLEDIESITITYDKNITRFGAAQAVSIVDANKTYLSMSDVNRANKLSWLAVFVAYASMGMIVLLQEIVEAKCGKRKTKKQKRKIKGEKRLK